VVEKTVLGAGRRPLETNMLTATELRVHTKEIHALACRLSPADGPDIAQRALMRAWEHREKFRPGADPGPWLRTITVRLFFSHCRSARLRHEAYERLGTEIRAMGSGYGESTLENAQGLGVEAFQRVALVELRERVELALVRVSEEHEQMLRIVDLGGASYKEAADQIGVPIGTVMSRLHRARRAAAAELKAVNAEMQ
jgi:RNA polymerase sigma-70 factor (ECF subfamily)